MKWKPEVSDLEDYKDLELCPYQRLWLNVIYRAVHDVIHYEESLMFSLDKTLRFRNLSIAKESKKWIMSNSIKEGGFLWALEMVFPNYNTRHLAIKIRETCSIDLRLATKEELQNGRAESKNT